MEKAKIIADMRAIWPALVEARKLAQALDLRFTALSNQLDAINRAETKAKVTTKPPKNKVNQALSMMHALGLTKGQILTLLEHK